MKKIKFVFGCAMVSSALTIIFIVLALMKKVDSIYVLLFLSFTSIFNGIFQLLMEKQNNKRKTKISGMLFLVIGIIMLVASVISIILT